MNKKLSAGAMFIANLNAKQKQRIAAYWVLLRLQGWRGDIKLLTIENTEAWLSEVEKQGIHLTAVMLWNENIPGFRKEFPIPEES